MNAKTLIHCNHVSFSYDGEKKIFDQFNFKFNQHMKAALIGKNGCGKTTLIHLIMGLLKPDTGEINLFGMSCRTEKQFVTARTKIGFVFQDPNDQLFCPTVYEDIAFGPLNLGVPKADIEERVTTVLVQMGLLELKDRVTYSLSDGQKKLISIATVLSMQPELLILDEPTTSLDFEAIGRIEAILHALTIPYLIISHDHHFLKRVTTSTFSFIEGENGTLHYELS